MSMCIDSFSFFNVKFYAWIQENIRNVDSIDSNQKLVYSRNSAVDTCEFISCEIPCFNFIGSSSSSFVRKTPSLTGKLDNTGVCYFLCSLKWHIYTLA